MKNIKNTIEKNRKLLKDAIRKKTNKTGVGFEHRNTKKTSPISPKTDCHRRPLVLPGEDNGGNGGENG